MYDSFFFVLLVATQGRNNGCSCMNNENRQYRRLKGRHVLKIANAIPIKKLSMKNAFDVIWRPRVYGKKGRKGRVAKEYSWLTIKGGFDHLLLMRLIHRQLSVDLSSYKIFGRKTSHPTCLQVNRKQPRSISTFVPALSLSLALTDGQLWVTLSYLWIWIYINLTITYKSWQIITRVYYT